MSYEEQDHEDGVADDNITAITSALKSSLRRIAQQQTQEIAASVAALTKRVEATERELRYHVHVHDGRMECPAFPTDPPTPGADDPADDAFVDALCREYARRGGAADESGVRFYAQGMYAVLTDSPGSCADQDLAMIARAAALPALGAPAPVTITREQFGAALDCADGSKHPPGARGWARSFLRELGIEVTE